MDWISHLLMLFIAVGLGVVIKLLTKAIHVEVHEVTPVRNLMVVQHFNTGHFAQIVDMSMLESHGIAKLDQYFVDIPFEEEQMEAGGFQRRYIEVDDAEGIITYWKLVRNTELILVRGSESGDYWLWGKEEEDG